jgi:hypothetical protein
MTSSLILHIPHYTNKPTVHDARVPSSHASVLLELLIVIIEVKKSSPTSHFHFHACRMLQLLIILTGYQYRQYDIVWFGIDRCCLLKKGEMKGRGPGKVQSEKQKQETNNLMSLAMQSVLVAWASNTA